MNRSEARARFEQLLGILLVGSIVGITLTVNSLIGRFFDVPRRLGTGDILLNAVIIAGWSLVAWLAYRGRKVHRGPPQWAILTVVALGWAAVLINHYR